MSGGSPNVASAVEVRERARRLSWLAIASFLLLLLGAFVGLLVFERYQPLDAGSVIRSFSLGLLTLWLLLAWKAWEVLRNPTARAGARLGILVPALVPWVFAGFLWLNGALDRSPASLQATIVVTTHASPRDWLQAFRYEVVVRSWRPGRRLEGVMVRKRADFESYRRGDPVTVEVRGGFFGLAWVSALRKR